MNVMNIYISWKENPSIDIILGGTANNRYRTIPTPHRERQTEILMFMRLIIIIQLIRTLM